MVARLGHLHMQIDIHQFSLICDLLGSPPESVLKTIASENVGEGMRRLAVHA